MTRRKFTPLHSGSPPSTNSPFFQWHLQNTRTSQIRPSSLKEQVSAVSKQFHPVILEFQRFIENDPTINLYFHQLFDQIPQESPYLIDRGGAPQVRDYMQMLERFNEIITRPPKFDNPAPAGVPVNFALNWPMGTPCGLIAFLDVRVNQHLRKMLNVWAEFLSSPESTSVLNTTDKGWLGPSAMAAMRDSANNPPHWSFEGTFMCDPDARHYGFKSWDDFFTRRLRPSARPIATLADDNVIVNSCEAAPYHISTGVKEIDQFWLKGEHYSLRHMFADDHLTSQFIGGTIYQAFLDPTSYHRWHSPISGTIVQTNVIPGSYYAEAPCHGIPGTSSLAPPEAERLHNTEAPLKNPPPLGLCLSQSYISNVATRAPIFIRADNPAIGLMCFLAVGMCEVSTCDITVSVGQRVGKGDELGTFHYGGSTYCLVFRKGVELRWDLHGQKEEELGCGTRNILVNERIATVVSG